MSELTRHGENIADQVQTEDAYGDSGDLTNADVWQIIDNLHTHMVDTRSTGDPIFGVLETAMRALEMIDEDLPL